MTTLAKVGNCIGIDSRVTAGNEVVSDGFEKFIQRGPKLYLFVGLMANMERLVDAIQSSDLDFLEKYLPGIDIIEFDQDKATFVHHYFCNEHNRVSSCGVSHTFFLGSGYGYAAGAVEALNQNADYKNYMLVKKSIEVAKAIDCKTGGEVHVFYPNN